MINPIYEEFPDVVTADGDSYKIITDFREWVRFADMMSDKNLPTEDKIFLLKNWFIEPPETLSESMINAVFAFYRADELEPDKPEIDEENDSQEQIQRPPVFDWKIDARYIIGDFQRYYGINLLSCDMHWWRFRCLFAALPDDSETHKRIAYRSADISQIKDKSERRRILEIQRKIAIPFEYDDNTISAMFDI